MKRILSICLLCSILLSLCGFHVQAAGIAISVGNATGSSGNSVSIPITLSGNMGFTNIGIEIEYDTSALTLTNATSRNTGATYTSAQNITTNPYNMGWDSTSNNTYNGTIALLDFDISANAAPGNYPIKVSFYRGRDGDYTDGEDVNYDENFDSLNLSYIDGYITVSNGSSANNSISVSDIQNNPLAFKANLQSSEQITGIAIAAVYDADNSLIAVKYYNAASEVEFSFADIEGAAKIKIFWWDSINGMTPQAKSKTTTL